MCVHIWIYVYRSLLCSYVVLIVGRFTVLLDLCIYMLSAHVYAASCQYMLVLQNLLYVSVYLRYVEESERLLHINLYTYINANLSIYMRISPNT